MIYFTTPASGYDGGDCCDCTCISTDEHTCGDLGKGGFACIDPSAPCTDDDDYFEGSFSFSQCNDALIADGVCDRSNNNYECGGICSWYILPCRGWGWSLMSITH